MNYKNLILLTLILSVTACGHRRRASNDTLNDEGNASSHNIAVKTNQQFFSAFTTGGSILIAENSSVYFKNPSLHTFEMWLDKVKQETPVSAPHGTTIISAPFSIKIQNHEIGKTISQDQLLSQKIHLGSITAKINKDQQLMINTGTFANLYLITEKTSYFSDAYGTIRKNISLEETMAPSTIQLARANDPNQIELYLNNDTAAWEKVNLNAIQLGAHELGTDRISLCKRFELRQATLNYGYGSPLIVPEQVIECDVVDKEDCNPIQVYNTSGRTKIAEVEKQFRDYIKCTDYDYKFRQTVTKVDTSKITSLKVVFEKNQQSLQLIPTQHLDADRRLLHQKIELDPIVIQLTQ